jgi:F-type H+-transporting ATPase subunit b
MPDSLFTFIAQVVNFLLIVFILRIILFKKIVAAIDGRQEEISVSYEKAEEDEEEARKMRSELEEKNKDFREKRKELIDNAKQEAEEKRKELVNDGRKELEEKRNNWEKQLEKEQSRFLKELKEMAAKELINLMEKALTDLSNERLEKNMADKFIATLKEKKTDFVHKEDNSENYVVKSSFTVSEETREEFTSLLGPVEFTRDESFHGITLEKNGQRMEWTIEGWLESFASALEERLEELQEQSV